MTQIALLSGIYTDTAGDYRTAYPRNLVPVPVSQGVSTGYLRPADGIVAIGDTPPGLDRGGINWNGAMYRVSGTKLISVSTTGQVTTLGDVGGAGQVRMDYSFDRLAIASGVHLFYWDGSTLTQVTDTNLGPVVDMLWIAGYFMTTDGTSTLVTELTDPTKVMPLEYGSSEGDPDPIVALKKLNGEVYVFNRYTTEIQQNVGDPSGSVESYPFATIEGSEINRGAIGTFGVAFFLGSFAFLGSGRDESPGVWLVQSADTLKLSTREIDIVLQGYTEAQLAAALLEVRTDKGHQHLYLHLPDQTLVYDGAASLVIGQPIWFTLTTSIVGPGAYRGRNLVWCYDRWNVGDPTTPGLGQLDPTVSTHFGQTVGWDFSTQILYNESMGAIVHAIELIALTGRTALGVDPTIWTSWSADGMTWSQERPISAGKRGERTKRLQWRGQGRMQTQRIQKFRGTSDTHASFARLEMTMEPLAN